MPSENYDRTALCTVHGKPATYSYCGGYWFCAGAYGADGADQCDVADDVEAPDDDDTDMMPYAELGGEG